MGNKSRTFGINSRKIAKLLEVISHTGDKAQKESLSSEEKFDLLRQRLEKRLKPEMLAVSAVLTQDSSILESVDHFPERTIQELLLDRRTDTPLLLYIKKYGAKLSHSACSDAELKTANVLYYAAIASSLVFHQEKNTEFSYVELEEAFGKLKGLNWLEPELGKLFQKAISVCKTEKQTTQP